jgi:hypothetical protein
MYAWYGEGSGLPADVQTKIELFMNTYLSDATLSINDLFGILQDHADSHYEDNRIGLLLTRMMIKACAARIEHPGLAALHYRNENYLAEHFPLPLLLYNSVYYYERHETGSMMSITNRLPQLRFDQAIIECVTLGALSGMSRQPLTAPIKATSDPSSPNHSHCGFIDHRTRDAQCWFTLHDFGCPGSQLTKDQDDRRKSGFVNDWCHWKTACRSIGLDTTLSGKEFESLHGTIDYESKWGQP